MAQFRQPGGAAEADHHQQPQPQQPEHVSVGIRSGASHKHHHHSRHSRHRHRRLKSSGGAHRRISATVLITFLLIAFLATVVSFLYLSSHNKEISSYYTHDDEIGNDTDFLTNVTRTQRNKVLHFGHGSGIHGRDSHYWDKDDRRRDDDYSEDDLKQVQERSTDNSRVGNGDKISTSTESYKDLPRKSGLYNEAGRKELKRYEAEYEASLRSIQQTSGKTRDADQLIHDPDIQNQDEKVDASHEYDDAIDSQDSQKDERNDKEHGNDHYSDSEEADEFSLHKQFRNSDEDDPKLRHDDYKSSQSDGISSSNRRMGPKKKPRRHKYVYGYRRETH